MRRKPRTKRMVRKWATQDYTRHMGSMGSKGTPYHIPPFFNKLRECRR